VNRNRILGTGLLLLVLASLTVPAARADEEPFKWYGIGGELSGGHRWLGRIGITQALGAEVLLGLDWESEAHSDYSLGAGVIYDYAPTSEITPFTMCRAIVNYEENGKSKTSLQFEAGGGVEYIIKKRIGISAELNFRFSFDPSRILTTTLLRAYFYL
jgi:hypothetical protein